jgi:hypothetical protein
VRCDCSSNATAVVVRSRADGKHGAIKRLSGRSSWSREQQILKR